MLLIDWLLLYRRLFACPPSSSPPLTQCTRRCWLCILYFRVCLCFCFCFYFPPFLPSSFFFLFLSFLLFPALPFPSLSPSDFPFIPSLFLFTLSFCCSFPYYLLPTFCLLACSPSFTRSIKSFLFILSLPHLLPSFSTTLVHTLFFLLQLLIHPPSYFTLNSHPLFCFFFPSISFNRYYSEHPVLLLLSCFPIFFLSCFLTSLHPPLLLLLPHPPSHLYSYLPLFPPLPHLSFIIFSLRRFNLTLL